MAELVSALVAFAADSLGSQETALIGRERHRQLLEAVAASLRRSMAAIGQGEELAAEDLRAAAYSLGRLLGRVDVEDVLDAIFREFCVGK
jgi:tRNA modification GTPase